MDLTIDVKNGFFLNRPLVARNGFVLVIKRLLSTDYRDIGLRKGAQPCAWHSRVANVAGRVSLYLGSTELLGALWHVL